MKRRKVQERSWKSGKEMVGLLITGKKKSPGKELEKVERNYSIDKEKTGKEEERAVYSMERKISRLTYPLLPPAFLCWARAARARGVNCNTYKKDRATNNVVFTNN
jgi:hypothetical protein